MMSIWKTRRPLAVGLLTIFALSVFAIAQPDSAEAHDTPPWKCQYLMWDQPDGQRYSWKVNNCIPWRTTHTLYHRYGWTWKCYTVTGSEHVRCIIRKVFGTVGQASKAVSVARCESTFRTWARNGQYRGIFQMGSSERARFGHGSTALAQAQAALRYYRLSGWRPWACA